MIKINKFIRNKSYQFILAGIIGITVLVLNFYLAEKNKQTESLSRSIDNIYVNKSLNFIINNLNPKFKIIELEIEEGDTFEKILNKINIPLDEKTKIIKKLSKFKFINNLYKGQSVNFKIDNNKPIKVINISIELTKSKSLVFSREAKSNEFTYK